jgi:hypothetical protein
MFFKGKPYFKDQLEVPRSNVALVGTDAKFLKVNTVFVVLGLMLME